MRLKNTVCLVSTDGGPKTTIMFKMEAGSDGRKAVLRLSGRMQATDLDQLRARIGKNMRSVVLDLKEVTLVDLDVVVF